MKRILYSLLIFISIFFVVDKVSAVTSDVYDMSKWIDVSEFTLPDGITEENYNIIIVSRFNGQGYKLFYWSKDIERYPRAAVDDYLNVNPFPYFIKSSTYTFEFSTVLTGTGPGYVNVYDESKPFSKVFDISNSEQTTGTFTFNVDYVVYTSVNIEYVKSGAEPYGYALWFDLSKVDFEEEPEPYTFDEYIDDVNYSKMIFNFDLSILESRDHVFDLTLNNFSIENEINDGILYETERFEISYPYLEYETSTGLKDVLYLKDYDDKEIKEKRKVFVGSYIDILPDDVISLKLIIPLYDTTNYQLWIQLVSWFPFEVSYETEEEMNSYYQYLDLSNKYGAMFIPKLVANNSHLTSYFLTRGIDTIYVYDTYDYKEAPIEIYEDVSDFTYSFSYDQQQYNLFFKTNTYSNSATIYYDTRYFDYQIVDSKYLIGSITNPNTGENHYIDFSNTANVEFNFANIGDVFNFIAEKIDSSGESYLLFKDSVSTFFNTMPTDIYILILTILAVILIGTALALGGWK